MKFRFNNILIFIICFSSICYAQTNLYHLYVEGQQQEVNPNQNKFADKTKDAVMAMPGVQERADYLLWQLQKNTLGEYADEVMLLSPLFTGKLEFKLYEFDVYYKHFSEKAGVEYKFHF